MKGGYFFVIAAVLFIGGFFVFGFNAAPAAEGKVLISEVKISGLSSADEFIELYNNSSSSESLSNWKLCKYTKTGLKDDLINPFSSVSITPFGYLLIVHQNYTGTVIGDITYASSSLADNNYLYLYDATDVAVDSVGWGSVTTSYRLTQGNPGSTKSLSRQPNDENGNGQDTDDDVSDFFPPDNPSPQNSLSPSRPVWPPIEVPTSTPTTTPPTDPPTTTPTTSIDWSFLKINEFVSDPASGNEWVELYNSATGSIDLSGGWVCDSRGATSTYACKSATGTVPAGGWLLFDLFTASYLNNDGDSVILRNSDGAEIDSVIYPKSSAPATGQSLARKVDGADTDNLADWAITTALTPGAANSIVSPPPPASGGGGTYTPPKTEEPVIEIFTTSTAPTGLVINEIYPNPPGTDTNDEFIEIKNISDAPIDLTGWKLQDLSQSHAISGSIAPNGILARYRSSTTIALNNTTKETVKLVTPNKQIADSISYDSAFEGASFARNASGTFLWTTEPTPGQENKFSRLETGIVWKVIAPSTGEIGEMLTFDAEDTADERGGEISFVWNFGDDKIFNGGIITQAFASSGLRAVTITASSTSGSFGIKKITVQIGGGLALNDTGVVISEIYANPDGDDTNEFIELYNSGPREVDLTGWRLLSLSGKPFIFATGTLIAPEQVLVFYRVATKISLNNNGDKVALINRDGETVDIVRFGKSPSGASYALANGIWQWSDPFPGRLNAPPTQAVLGAKLSVGATNSSGAKGVSYRPMTIADAREEALDSGVIVRGIVAVLPGVFGKQYFYIFDNANGIQVYQYKSDFPDLKIGDNVEITGVISQALGAKRIKIKNRSAIDILATDSALEPLALEPEDAGEDNAGALIKSAGQITEIKTNYMYLDNGAAEMKVYLKKNAKIDKTKFKEGENAEITGIWEQGTNEMQLMPRGQADIAVLGPSDNLVKKEELAAENNSKQTAEKYLLAFAGGLSALLLGLLARAKGAVAIKAVKNIIASIFTRG